MNTKYLYFTDKDLAERAGEIKDDFWNDMKAETLKMVKRLMENCLNEELEMVVGASPYERAGEKRQDYRNGYYHRDLGTQIGYIPLIRVPRLRKEAYKTKVFKRYKRRQEKVNEMLLEMFLKGISTREVGLVAKPLLGKEISAGTISNIAKGLDYHVKNFHNRKIEDKYEYLIMDGITVKVKNAIKTEKKVILACYGISKEGIRELISFKLAKKENEANWTIYLNDLMYRGLIGKGLKLIVTDGHKGLIAALDMVYPTIERQRCWVHKLRNVANKMPKRLHNSCLFEAKLIYKGKNKKEAINRFKEWKTKWEKEVSGAISCLETNLDDLLRFYDYPEEHWKKIRTTNAIERSFREVRRRIRIMNVFTNDASCNRIIYAIFCSLNNKWKNHSLKGFPKI